MSKQMKAYKEDIQMGSTLVQFRCDSELKEKTTALYESLGLDLPSAFRLFMKIFFSTFTLKNIQRLSTSSAEVIAAEKKFILFPTGFLL